MKCQYLVTSWKHDNDRVDHWQKALHSVSILLCVSSPDALGHSNGQIWDRKNVFLLKIVRILRVFSFIFSKDYSLQAGIPQSGVFRVQYLVVFSLYLVQSFSSKNLKNLL